MEEALVGGFGVVRFAIGSAAPLSAETGAALARRPKLPSTFAQQS
jgi:hypothetical protein